jgi:hypothetical protein
MRQRNTYSILCLLAMPVCVSLNFGCSVQSTAVAGSKRTDPDCLILAESHALPSEIRTAINPIEFSGELPEGIPPLSLHPFLGPQLFQTVFTADCTGRVSETLATSVRDLTDGAGISFGIRPGFTYSDGSAVSAKSVVDEWNRMLTPSIAVDSIRTSGLDAIQVYSKLSPNSLRSLLTDPAFVVRTASESGVVGTGAYRVSSSAEEKGLRLEGIASSTLPDIVVVQTQNDLRDLLPSSAQIGLTTDPTVVDYATSLPGLFVEELAAGPTYLLVTRARLNAIRALPEASPLQSVDTDFKEALAGTAVRSLAEAYVGSQLQGLPDHCDLAPSLSETVSGQPQSPAPRLVFDASDDTSRDIAERIVALQQTLPDGTVGENIRRIFPGFVRGDKALVPTGKSDLELRESLREGTDAAYIIMLPGSPVVQCLGLESLVQQSAWLQEGFSASPLFAVPLIRTRQFLVAVTAEVPALYVDGYGRMELDPSIYR